MHHSILMYGRDAELLEVRKMVLRTSGNDVLATTNPIDVEVFLRTKAIEVLILCHTVPEGERRRILNLIPLLSPGTKALVLIAGARSSPEEHHANLDTMEGPRRLLEAIEQLARDRSSAARAE